MLKITDDTRMALEADMGIYLNELLKEKALILSNEEQGRIISDALAKLPNFLGSLLKGPVEHRKRTR